LAARALERADVPKATVLFIGEAVAVVAGGAADLLEQDTSGGSLGRQLQPIAVRARRCFAQRLQIGCERVQLDAQTRLGGAQRIADGSAAVDGVRQQAGSASERPNLPLEVLHLVRSAERRVGKDA